MVTYENFCEGSTSEWLENTDAKAVFDFLCKPESVYSMIAMSKLGLPAISGIVKELEDKFSDAPKFPLREGVNRQLVGKMVKFVLGQFGYEINSHGDNERVQLRTFTGARFFRTSAVYAPTAEAVNSLSIQII